MLAAVLTAFFFALSAIFSQRTARLFGSLQANFYRLCGACAILGLIVAGKYLTTLDSRLFPWYFLSGAIGFGLGDIALFLSYSRLGSRLTLLIHFCLGTIIGAVADWFFIEKTMTMPQAGAVVLILTGLAVTLLAKKATPRQGKLAVGLFWAVLSAAAMGLGTTLSQIANHHAESLGMAPPPGISQAFQRCTAGVLVAFFGFLVVTYAAKKLPSSAQAPKSSTDPNKTDKKPKSGKGCAKIFWLVGTMTFGPVIGVSCYQWAIMETQSSAIVLAVAATSTLMIIPLARWIEKDHPGWRQILGTGLAAAGIVWLCLLRN